MSKVEPVEGKMSIEMERNKFVEKHKTHLEYQSTVVKVGDRPIYQSDSMSWLSEKE